MIAVDRLDHLEFDPVAWIRFVFDGILIGNKQKTHLIVAVLSEHGRRKS